MYRNSHRFPFNTHVLSRPDVRYAQLSVATNLAFSFCLLASLKEHEWHIGVALNALCFECQKSVNDEDFKNISRIYCRNRCQRPRERK